MFKSVKKLGVLAVGGGNDSISSLWLLGELRKAGLQPEQMDVICMLPENVNYTGLEHTTVPRIGRITSKTARAIDGKTIKRLPEAALASSMNRFGIRQLLGIDLAAGSLGMAASLNTLLDQEKYDLLLAVDVGGDFIAHYDNTKVLSPMMDAYAAFTLKTLQSKTNTPILGAVFGLGFDGESTEVMIEEALLQIQGHQVLKFTDSYADITKFYMEEVRPHRRSQTGDLMVHALGGQLLPEYQVSRPFHVRTPQGTHKHQVFKPFQPCTKRALEIHLFHDLSRIHNRFIVPCSNGLDWERQIRDNDLKLNHELCGQILQDTYIGTPSWFFDEIRPTILADIKTARTSRLYDKIITYSQDASATH